MLHDDVLIEIFDLYVIESSHQIQEWITLAHVCQRWRSVVFQSPHRLNLRLLCGPNTPARGTLDIWPPFPLIIRCVNAIFHDEPTSLDNIIAALELNDRVCQIQLIFFSSSHMGYVADSEAMPKPFPDLTDLWLGIRSADGPGSILPKSFLGGTAPRLRSLVLDDVPFPGLPKLLLSVTHLVKLDLYGIPVSGYIPPEAIATSLSALTSLEYLRLHFRYPRPRPALDRRRPRPPTRSILLSLTKIEFKGASEYLEEILARIDAPRLHKFHMTFFNQLIFDTPQLFQFISRRPTLRASEKCHIAFGSEAIIVKFPSHTSDDDVLSVEISCTTSEWQFSSAEQILTSSLPPISTLEDLYISKNQGNPPRWQDDVENTLWLELLHPFAAVKNLYLCDEIVPRMAPALQELVGARTTEVLPILENIFLEGLQQSRPLPEGIEKLFAARQLTSHPVGVSRWDMDSGQCCSMTQESGFGNIKAFPMTPSQFPIQASDILVFGFVAHMFSPEDAHNFLAHLLMTQDFLRHYRMSYSQGAWYIMNNPPFFPPPPPGIPPPELDAAIGLQRRHNSRYSCTATTMDPSG